MGSINKSIKRISWLIGLAMIVTLDYSCSIKEDYLENTTSNPNDYPGVSQGVIKILGAKLDNPYTLSNMQQAYHNLISGARLADDSLSATHLYVRLLPTDSSDVHTLLQDSTLNLYDYPLDYEVVSEGDYYHDPDLAGSIYTWMYTVVPVDYSFPDMEYEIIDELYIGDQTEAVGRIAISWEQLESEAMAITGYTQGGNGANGRLEKYNPQGSISVQLRNGSTAGAVTGVRGVKVRARFLVRIKHDYTDDSGNFFIDETFNSKVNYSLEWETHNYKITNALGFSINFDRDGRTDGEWNPVFNYAAGNDHWAAGTMINAIYDYKHEATTHHIKEPSGGTVIKIRPIWDDKSSNVVNGSFKHYGIAPFIVSGFTGMYAAAIVDLALRNDVRFFLTSNHDTGRIYQTIMHELGHMSHVLKSPVNFQTSYLVNPMVVESWATATEYYFTLPYYPARVGDNPVTTGIIEIGLADQRRQDIIAGSSSSWQYTPFFIDLRDNTNQSITRPDGGVAADYADDDVSGYSLLQMQDALDHRTTLDGVCTYLSNSYTNTTEANLDDLLTFYQDIKDNH